MECLLDALKARTLPVANRPTSAPPPHLPPPPPCTSPAPLSFVGQEVLDPAAGPLPTKAWGQDSRAADSPKAGDHVGESFCLPSLSSFWTRVFTVCAPTMAHQELLKNLPPGTDLQDKLLNVATDLCMVSCRFVVDETHPKCSLCLSRSHVAGGIQGPVWVLKSCAWCHEVENIALLNNAKDVGFVGVNMYVDDEGAIKDAAFNRRASDIAACCGKPLQVRRAGCVQLGAFPWIPRVTKGSVQVRGDAFLARIFDNEDEFKRLDLLMSEVRAARCARGMEHKPPWPPWKWT